MRHTIAPGIDLSYSYTKM